MEPQTNNIVTLVYDGECPLCSYAATALRIRKAVGCLEIIDARNDISNPILNEIYNQKIDLDNSMVFVFNNQFYQGAEALEIMANLSTKNGFYNRLFANVFKYPSIAKFAYPILRAMRNFLLWVLGVKPIGNLAK